LKEITEETTVMDVLREWMGSAGNGLPSITELEKEHGDQWRKDSETTRGYEIRKLIMRSLSDRCLKYGRTNDAAHRDRAVEEMETLKSFLNPPTITRMAEIISPPGKERKEGVVETQKERKKTGKKRSDAPNTRPDKMRRI
jgi:hypothetical protein